jgi:hypothetical protein
LAATVAVDFFFFPSVTAGFQAQEHSGFLPLEMALAHKSIPVLTKMNNQLLI